MDKTTTIAQHPLRDAFRQHAEDHYNDGGWDVIVECWEDSYIDEFLTGNAHHGEESCKTLQEALERAAPLISVWSERQAEARYEWEMGQ